MADQIAEFCGNCGTPNTSNNKFCQKCGKALINNTGIAPLSPAPSIPPSLQPLTTRISQRTNVIIEEAKQTVILRQKIAEKQVELDNANSIAGPLILAIIGLLTAVWLIGILLIIAALIWYEIRYSARPKLRTEIATLEAQLKELERM
jgi:hypothetical protein